MLQEGPRWWSGETFDLVDVGGGDDSPAIAVRCRHEGLMRLLVISRWRYKGSRSVTIEKGQGRNNARWEFVSDDEITENVRRR